jgi:DNA polymerase III alpha subunit
MTITDIDPLRYQLLFDGSHPDRVIEADFERDFDFERRRSQRIRPQKYGDDSRTIITYEP